MTLQGEQQRPFNWVLLTDQSGKERKYTRPQFEGLRIDDRVRALLNKRVRFFVDDEEISVRDAMSAQG